MGRLLVPAGILLWLLPAVAQQSASFKLEEHVFNAGGHPADGVTLSSSGYRLTLDALGEAVAGTGAAGASYVTDAGFASVYPPPGEVGGLLFLDGTGLQWGAERSVGVYNVYRDLVSSLAGLQYGACWQQDLTTPSTSDSTPVPAADGFFYLVTAENRLGEEGTKGFRGDGNERQGIACP